jgi:hypothetical protein
VRVRVPASAPLSRPAALIAVFAACGTRWGVFVLSTLAALPKVFMNVFLGYAFGLQADARSSPSPRCSFLHADARADASAAITAINYSIIGVVSSAALPVLLYMRARQIAVTPDVVYERRRGRAGRYAAPLDQGAGGPEAGGSAKTAGDPSST